MTTYGDIKSGEVAAPASNGLALNLIQIDGGTQSRATLNQHVVDEYAEALKGGAAFPPIVVFYDGKKYWLADGFHRFHAYRQIGRAGIDADVRQGTRRDAILHSVGANETHGLRRTNDDKRRAVLTLLDDGEWAKWSDREIGRKCAVSHEFVRKMRPVTVNVDSEDRAYTTKHGTVATMKTGGINAGRSTAVLRENQTTEPATPEAIEAKAFEPETVELPAGGAETEEISAEALVPQGVDGGAEPEKPVEEIAPPRNIFRELVALWKEAGPGDRQDFKAYIRGSEAVAKLSITESNPATGTGGGDVDRSAVRVGHAGQTTENALSGQARNSDQTVERNTSGPDDKRVFPSDGDVIAAVKGKARLANAAGVEPSPSESNSETPAVHPVPNSRQAGRAPEVSPPPASGATPFDNPRCLKPETCHFAHSRDCCFDCSLAWAHRPRDEQIRLWAEANEAAEKKGEAA